MLKVLAYSLFICKEEEIYYMKKKKILRIASIIIGTLLVSIGIACFAICQIGKIELRKPVELTIDNAMLEIENEYHSVYYQGKEYEYKEHIVNVLCLGIDKEEQLWLRNDVDNSVGQADAIYLVSMDTKEHKIRIIAIPRDTMVILQMYNSENEYMGMRDGQVTLQYAYGDGMKKSAQLMTGQVSNILNQIPINAYVAINVHSLWTMNAAVGGVDITMDMDYTDLNPAFIQGETIRLTEKLLENYLRERNVTETGSAYTRLHRQKQYMLAFFDTAKERLKTDVTLPLRLLDVLEKDMEIEVTLPELAYLITQGLGCEFSMENICTLPGVQVQGEEYEEFYLDQEAVDALVIELFYEEK